MIRIGIYGTTGYTGVELVKILQRHPQAEIVFATSSSSAGKSLRDLFAAAPPIPLIHPDHAPVDQIEVAFLCLGHGDAAAVAVKLLQAGVRVIDLSADFRLKDAAAYQQWYHHPHPDPELLASAVYGLTEFAREQLPQAQLVANPGCYPTSILLALQPLCAANAIAGTVISDSKSGVSGAGRVPKQNTHFVEVADNFSPYSIGRQHRHLPEIEQGLGMWQAEPPSLIFSPHLLPVPRGILSTIYVPLHPGWTDKKLHELYHTTYDHEPFVRVLKTGQVATLHHAIHTNLCAIGLTLTRDTLILTSAIDNLIKGASGQAVQNLNGMMGIDERMGLR